jgi:Polyketide cyclase / dehydrase and lipid transport
MPRAEFNMITNWDFDAPLALLWQYIAALEEWPSWWPRVKEVRLLQSGDAHGIGAKHHMRWSTALGYHLDFDTLTTQIAPYQFIEAQARGDLTGVGRWIFSPTSTGCRVRYEWQIHIDQPILAPLAPLLRPLYVWNHNHVMEAGRKALLVKVGERPAP